MAGCGGSHKQGTTSSSSTAPVSSATVASSTSTAGSATSASSSATASSTTTAQSSTITGTATNGSPPPSGPHIAATYSIGAGDNVSPQTVAVPSGVAVDLTVVSRDGKPHRVLVRTAPAHALQLPAGGRVSLLLTGLPDGSYVLLVDSRTTAILQVGAQPGP